MAIFSQTRNGHSVRTVPSRHFEDARRGFHLKWPAEIAVEKNDECFQDVEGEFLLNIPAGTDVRICKVIHLFTKAH